MIFQFLSPILADIGTWIPIIVIAFMFINWIMNLASGKTNQSQRVGRHAQAPRPREGRLQGEIDVFLEQVRGKSVPHKAAKGTVDEPLEIVEVEELRHLVRPRRLKQFENNELQLVTDERQQPKRKPGVRIAERQGPGSQDLGDSLRQHVASRMKEGRVASHVQQHLDHDVDQSVLEHLGSFSAEKQTVFAEKQTVTVPRISAGSASITPSGIVRLLRDPVGIRQAGLVSEVLRRPRPLRGPWATVLDPGAHSCSTV